MLECEAIITTDEDRKDDLEKEYHGEQRDDTTEEEMEIARRQEKIQKNYQHGL